MPENGPDQSKARGRVLSISAFLLGLLSALVVFVAVDHTLNRTVLQPPLMVKLHAAAQAVLPAGDGQKSGQGAFEIPVEQQYDRGRAVELALELDSQRRKMEELLAESIALRTAGVKTSGDRSKLARIVRLAGEARSRLADFLALSPPQATALLYGFGWPWLHHDLSALQPQHLAPGIGDLPAPLRRKSQEEINRMLQRIRQSPGWPAAKTALTGQYGLSENEAETLRAYLCRRSLEDAFAGFPDSSGATENLTEYVELSDAQLRTVLAMRGALDLTLSGTQAYPALIWLLEQDRSLAVPLLKRCTRVNDVQRQAELAVSRLGGPGWKGARRELIALGPFGAAALEEALQQADFQPTERGRHILQTIRGDWPADGAALDLLGPDSEAWRRWYDRAQDVL